MRYRALMGFGICVAVVTIVQPAWAQVVQVTGIEVKRRTDGVEVRLETSENARLDVSGSLTKDLSKNNFGFFRGKHYRV